jgi:hypothetical protein
MPEDEHIVRCDIHGDRQETFVCQHVVMSLFTTEPVGFWWADDPGNSYPDAWCTSCNEVLKEEHGEWTTRSESVADIKLLCAKCYEKARGLNGVHFGPIPHNKLLHRTAR